MANLPAATNQIILGGKVGRYSFPPSPRCQSTPGLAVLPRQRNLNICMYFSQTNVMFQESPEEVPRTRGRRPPAGSSGGPAARRLSRKVPTPERQVPLDPPVGGGREGPRGRTAKWSRRKPGAAGVSPSPPDGRQSARSWKAREGKREGPPAKRTQQFNQIADGWAGAPRGSSQTRPEQEVPRTANRSPHLPSSRGDSKTPVWFARGLVPPSRLPPAPHTHSEMEEGVGNPDLALAV